MGGLRKLLDRWQLARYRQRMEMQAINDRRNAEHLERRKDGIKDAPPPGPMGPM